MMKHLKNLSLLVLMALCYSCTEDEPDLPAAGQADKKVLPWQTLIAQSSFNNYTNFHNEWNYLYPWGSDHNGSARMYGSPSDHNHVYLSSNKLIIKSQRIYWDEGYSSHDPYLYIKYHSGAVHSKENIVVNNQYPNYEIGGEFQVPTLKGTWPAFWITGVSSWPPESDIMEYKGSNQLWQNTYDGAWEETKTFVNAPWGWHSYKIWMEKVNSTDVDIHYYIDGNWVAKHRGSNFVNKPMKIIINMQMEGSSGTPGPTSDQYISARNVYMGRTKAY